MEKTTTKKKYSDIDLFHREIAEAAAILRSGGIALLPTDTVWSTVGMLGHPEAWRKLEKYLDRAVLFGGPELLVRDNQEAKQYLTHLHPRLETLWSFHVRPLTILFDNPANLPLELVQPEGKVAIRLVTDDFVRGLIETCGMPLIALPATSSDGSLALYFGQVCEDLVREMDFTAAYRRGEASEGELSVMARISSTEELEFIRE